MNKIKQSVLALAFVASASFSAAPAFATNASGTISNTGPGSNNQIVNNSDFTCTVTNNNQVTVTGNNSQSGVSGSGTVTGNTGAGGATSGSVTNSNGAVFNVTFTNTACTVTQASVPVTPNPATPAQTPTPVKAQGNGLGAATGTPTVLADTNGASIATVVASIAGVIALAAAGIRGYALLNRN